jgi:heavy metal translocating P-type ATPase
VTQAQEARPQLQRWFEKFSRAYALTIIGLAFIFALSFPFFLSISFLGKEGSIYRSLAFLIAASPCALIIAIPISYLSALSSCAKKGILLKGGINLDALSHCKTIAFDKTGTLTTGELTCQGIETLPTSNKSKLETAIALAYALEKNAVHPIAKAILNYATERQSHSISISNFRSLPGEGLEAEAFLHDQQAEVAIGHPEFIAEKVSPSLGREILEYSQKIKDRGELVAVLLMNQEPYFFCFQDTIRPKIAETIALLKKREGIKFVMLTGDHQQNAQRIASEVGIDEFYADLKPEDKLNIVSKLAAHQGLAMVGDGINDAPALARATIGICMGKVGSTAAIDAADIVLLHDNIELLDWLLDKSYRTQAIVKQNLVLALAAICIATIPALAGVIPLWLAVVLHEGGTVLVGLNGLRLLNR